MSTFDALPVILVSAINETTATKLITELIDNDVTDDYLKDRHSHDRVWRLVNKYYTANVRVHSLTDNGRLEVDPDAVEAHVIHLTEEECADAGAAAARAAAARAARGAWRRAAVRVLACEGARAPPALAAWAAAQRADALALRERAAAGDAPDAAGVGRARAALHAHAWRGLVRTDRARTHPPHEASSRTGSDEWDGSDGWEGSDGSGGSDGDSEAEELRAVEQAEAFAAALGALGPALAARPGPLAPPGAPRGAAGAAPGAHGAAGAPGAAGPPESRERAEALVHAFCRALGLDVDAC